MGASGEMESFHGGAQGVHNSMALPELGLDDTIKIEEINQTQVQDK